MKPTLSEPFAHVLVLPSAPRRSDTIGDTHQLGHRQHATCTRHDTITNTINHQDGYKKACAPCHSRSAICPSVPLPCQHPHRTARSTLRVPMLRKPKTPCARVQEIYRRSHRPRSRPRPMIAAAHSPPPSEPAQLHRRYKNRHTPASALRGRRPHAHVGGTRIVRMPRPREARWPLRAFRLSYPACCRGVHGPPGRKGRQGNRFVQPGVAAMTIACGRLGRECAPLVNPPPKCTRQGGSTRDSPLPCFPPFPPPRHVSSSGFVCRDNARQFCF